MLFVGDDKYVMPCTASDSVNPRYGAGVFALLWMAGGIDSAVLAGALYMSCLQDSLVLLRYSPP